ncbi:MAG: hypothetical protein H7X71_06965 [Chitinophagales bacterium]|nr:hypothetical protein [Chitinophagales bacterium]
MYSIHKFKNPLISLVSEAGRTFPVSQISSVTFFKDNVLMAACFWGNETKFKNNSPFIVERLFPAEQSPSCVIYDQDDYMNATEVEISGTGSDGNPFSMHCNVQFLQAGNPVYN